MVSRNSTIRGKCCANQFTSSTWLIPRRVVAELADEYRACESDGYIDIEAHS